MFLLISEFRVAVAVRVRYRGVVSIGIDTDSAESSPVT